MRLAHLLIAPVALVTTSAVAITPERSQAVTIAARTGEVVGAAEACGVPESELVELGRKVIGWARDTALDAAELRRAQQAHEAAVTRGADRMRRAGGKACEGAVAAFRDLERERR